jgi:hypothetical protein
MMAIETIRSMSRQAALKAAKAKRQPFVVTAEDVADLQASNPRALNNIRFPFIGDYTPKGWEKVDEHFVDSSGFGGPTEPALTQQSFYRRLQAGHGYAITEAGQFQVYIGEFRKVAGK